MNSPVSSLFVGDRLVSRCDDGRLEAEFALFDCSEVLLSPGFREEGYMSTAGFARARLYEGLVTADLAYEAFAAIRGRHMRPLARSQAVRGIIDQLGPYETFQGGRFVAARGRYAGVWLDLDALAAACPLRDAAILFQALHLVLVLEEVADDAPVRLLTSQTAGEGQSGGRTWHRVDLEAAQRLPWVLREMQAPGPTYATAHDEAEVREEILRDLRARASAAAIAPPRLAMLATAIARTGSTPPPGMPADAVPSTQRMSSRPAPRPSSSRPPPATASPSRAPPAPQSPVTAPAPERGSVDPAHLRNVARSLGALVERPPFMPDLAIGAARAWLAAGEPGFARHFARLVVDDANAPDDLRIQALEVLDTTPKTSQTARPPPMESIRPAPVIVLSQPPPPPAPPPAAPIPSAPPPAALTPSAPPPPSPQPVVAQVVSTAMVVSTRQCRRSLPRWQSGPSTTGQLRTAFRSRTGACSTRGSCCYWSRTPSDRPASGCSATISSRRARRDHRRIERLDARRKDHLRQQPGARPEREAGDQGAPDGGKLLRTLAR